MTCVTTSTCASWIKHKILKDKQIELPKKSVYPLSFPPTIDLRDHSFLIQSMMAFENPEHETSMDPGNSRARSYVTTPD